MTPPTWQSLLPRPPKGGRLIELWMTCFDAPEARLLVEHVLPALVRTDVCLGPDGAASTSFFAELGYALEALHGRLTIISSPAQPLDKDDAYRWLWRYVGHFMVGRNGRAVQHAKLWAFQWRVGNTDVLELHVSSTNLTSSAFKCQLQAGWKVMLTLQARGQAEARASWGELVPFLQALGHSAGGEAERRIARLLALLARATCPEGVAFVASVPGRRRGARQLAALAPTDLHILTPTVGEWRADTLAAWSEDVGVALHKTHLLWIADDHPWAVGAGWALSHAACKNLRDGKVRLMQLPTAARFASHHAAADVRWSHAKLYLLRRRQKHWLLLTSANWSIAAWGVARSAARNFELGVVFETEWTDLKTLSHAFEPPHTPFCVTQLAEPVVDGALYWAEATWDGHRIVLRARSTVSAPIVAEVAFISSEPQRVVLGSDCDATIAWTDALSAPCEALFTQGADELHADVIDLRAPAEFVQTPLPEIDPALEQQLRDALLLQRYGGPWVALDSPDSAPWESEINDNADAGECVTAIDAGSAAPAADYTMQLWIEARRAFGILDRWRDAYAKAAGDPWVAEQVRVDGERLRALFARRQGPGALIVAQELAWRLEASI